MHVDALTLAALADELRADSGAGLLGLRIEDVIQPTPHAVALQCWGGGRTAWLLASAHPQLARVHLVERKPQKLTTEPPAFVMLLRKHLEGARVVVVRQPAWERVLELGFARGAPGGVAAPAADGAGPAHPVVWLVVELMGRLSNLILRDDGGMILGALRLVGPEVNRYRTIAPNELYRPPPPQTRTLAGAQVPRLDGARATAEELAEELHVVAIEQLAMPANPKRPPRLAGLVTAQVMGFSQELGREVAARACADADAPLAADLPWPAIAEAVRGLAELSATHAWQPTLVLDAAEEPVAYAVYVPRQYGGATLRAMSGVSALLAAYYRRAEWRDAVEGAKGPLRRLLTAQRERCLRKADVLAAELAALDERDGLREEGELLLAYQAEVVRGASSVTLEHPYGATGDEAAPVTIALDPRFSAVENANRRFARYHKLRRAAALIPPQREANALELARIEQLSSDLALADSAAEIAQVREEVVEAGYLRDKASGGARGQQAQRGRPGKPGKAGKPGKSGKGGGKGGPAGGAPLRRQSADGMLLLVGKNSRQNEEVTFRQGSGADLWLHARGVPGAHVIIKSGGRPVSGSTLAEAAALAAYYSQARQAGSVPVDYTEQRYVRHMKGGGPGMVIYERERTLHAVPADRELETPGPR